MVEHKKTQPIQEFVSQDAEELMLMDVGCCNRKALSRVFRSKKFKNPKLEQLYQRYFFKLNQNNLTWLMGLVAALCVILVIFHYAGGSSSIVKGVVLGVIFLALIVLEIISNQGSFNHIQLYIVSYIVFGLLVIIVIVVTIDTSPQTASQGVWCTLFCIYMVYTLLPVRMRLSALAGITLASTHIACSAALNHGEPFLWKQVHVLVALLNFSSPRPPLTGILGEGILEVRRCTCFHRKANSKSFPTVYDTPILLNMPYPSGHFSFCGRTSPPQLTRTKGTIRERTRYEPCHKYCYMELG